MDIDVKQPVRVYHSEAKQGLRVSLDSERRHYLTRVHRLRVGDLLTVFDGKKHEYEAYLAEDNGKQCLQIGALLRTEETPPIRLTLAQGIPKQSKMGLILRQACELGVHELRPFSSAYGDIRLSPMAAEKKLARWESVLVEAARQSRRIHVPRIHSAASFSDMLDCCLKEGPAWIAYEGGGSTAINNLLDGETPSSLSLVVGPEGGFSDEEAALAKEMGAELISLGPRILRTETAGVALLAVIQSVWGDFDRSP